MKISKIAKTIGGYTFRKTIEPDNHGNVFVLQANNIINGQNIENINGLIKTSFQGLRTTTFLQKNDVILVSRGSGHGSFRAAVFLSDNSNVIASSSLFIIRLIDKDVLADYLAIYLNSLDGQNKLFKIAIGSSFHAIPRKALDDLEIPIPSIEKQKLIINLSINIKEQQKLVDYKYGLIDNIFNKILIS